jgi:hypothetical protein
LRNVKFRLLAVVGIVIGWVKGIKQMEVLDKLNQSSAATAATLTAVRQAQEASLTTQKNTLDNIMAMNDALQEQIDWNFAEVLQFSGSNGATAKGNFSSATGEEPASFSGESYLTTNPHTCNRRRLSLPAVSPTILIFPN